MHTADNLLKFIFSLAMIGILCYYIYWVNCFTEKKKIHTEKENSKWHRD